MLVRDANGACLLIKIMNGRYYLLEGVANRIMELCDGFRDLAEVREALCHQYQVEAAEIDGDIKEFVIDLVREGLFDIQLAEALSLDERHGTATSHHETANLAPL